MIYVFDFELKKDKEYVMKNYSCEYNGKNDSSKLELNDDNYRYMIFDMNKIIEYNYSNIVDTDIIVMSWKDEGVNNE